MSFRSGFVPIVGRPNVGKSTLLNRIIGQKIAITSPKPQTTWGRILGIKTRPDAQLIFVDTPGIHETKENFNLHMVRQAKESIKEGDVVLHVLDVTTFSPEAEEPIWQELKKKSSPLLLALNKIDLLKDPSDLDGISELCKRKCPYKQLIPISALTGQGVQELEEVLVSFLPEGPPYFPEDMVTDQNEKVFAREIIREKIFHFCHQEVPYCCAVVVEELNFNPQKDLIVVKATINVERQSQKGILIGKGGRMLKQIGTLARRELEERWGKKVYLELWVRVQEDWRDKDFVLRDLGLIG